ncbi:cytochrome-c peroxidase [Spirosoma flavum]|uniref:Cytochrome-c peroxidase n=2 Tax=Spirosoma flavum TaxID=2048557 RepID=A0ABW6AQM1_9BACT
MAVVLNACNRQTDGVAPVVLTTVPTSATSVSTSSDVTSLAQIALGKALFWDPILSGGKDVACATCHHPNNAYTDGLDLSLGENAVGYGSARRFILPNDVSFTKRNSPTILNTAYNGMDANGGFNPTTAPMFWDSRMASLELQVTGPMTTFEEMRGHAYTEGMALDSLVARLKAIVDYQPLFQQAFGTQQPITPTNIGKAIAAFERTLVALNSPYDRYQKGDKTAMTAAQIQGMQTFANEGCAVCHSGPMFSDYQAHVLSAPDNAKLAASDAGVNGTYAFRTPTLRNVGLTGPYMHNGTFQSLAQVVNFYDQIGDGNSQNPHVGRQQLDANVRRINLRNNEQAQIVAFRNALTDTGFDRSIPASVPSTLNPGGGIR